MAPRSVRITDLPTIKGEPLGPSEPVTVTQDMIDAFAEATGDHQWIHVDPERAAQGPFGTTVAHGYLTLSLVPQLVQKLLHVEGVGMGVNYGLNRCRFPAPVPSGSGVVATAQVRDVEERDDGGYQLTTEVTITVVGAERPSCVAETVARYYPA
ncbi:MAG: MaoC family dehydratase [Nitriliruptorales bacterium]